MIGKYTMDYGSDDVRKWWHSWICFPGYVCNLLLCMIFVDCCCCCCGLLLLLLLLLLWIVVVVVVDCCCCCCSCFNICHEMGPPIEQPFGWSQYSIRLYSITSWYPLMVTLHSSWVGVFVSVLLLCVEVCVIFLLLHERRPKSGCDTFSMFLFWQRAGIWRQVVERGFTENNSSRFHTGGNPPKRSSSAVGFVGIMQKQLL